MLSNSKLSAMQKDERKEQIRKLPQGSTLATDGVALTILAVPDGSVTRIFSAVKSADEIRFRRKVGEFYALHGFFWDASGMILPGFWTATEVLDGLQTQMD